MSNQQPKPVWCVAANVREQTPFGEEGILRRGHKHFNAGAKVYCFPMLWGDGYEHVKVVGHHRKTHRYITLIVDSKYLTNWRSELVYSPHVIREFAGFWDGTEQSRKRAESLAQYKNTGVCPKEYSSDRERGSFLNSFSRFLRNLINLGSL